MIDGGGVLVSIPSPARLAVHKLLVAQDRSAAFQTKSVKDVAQSAHVIDALDELRPGDLAAAWKEASSRGEGWKRALANGRKLLDRRHPDVFRRTKSALR